MTPKEKEEMAQRIAKRLVENPKLLEELKDRLLDDSVVPIMDLGVWEDRYLGIGIKKDFSSLRIPEQPECFTRLIVVVKELKISQLITKLKDKRMKIGTYSDSDLKSFDKVEDVVQRPDGDYAILVRDRQEADEELQNKSADDLQNEGLNTETLKERLLHGWAYYEETGKHLDEKHWTICAGSRHTHGSVPYVYCDPCYGRVDISWYGSGYQNSHERARQVVSS